MTIARTVVDHSPQIIIIGAGTAGLAAATTLAQSGINVHLYEKNAYAGGRTFSFIDNVSRTSLDNGQHLLMGCYHATRAWLDSLNTPLNVPQKSLPLNFYSPDGRRVSLNLPDWPAPWYALYGILRYKAIPLNERWQILRAGLGMRKRLSQHRYVSQWLDAWRFSDVTRQWFWNPICLAIMNQVPEDAPLAPFGEAMRRIFFGSRDDGRFIIPQKSLNDLLVEPALKILEQKRSKIHFHAFVRHIAISGDRVEGIVLRNGDFVAADKVILAVPPWNAIKILPPENKLVFQLQNYTSTPILSAYVWLEGVRVDTIFDGPMAGCIGTHIQWLFKKDNNCIQVTISNPGSAIFDAVSIWQKRITDDLLRLFKSLTPETISRIEIIKSVRATSNNNGMNSSPIPIRTTIRGLYVAGDWVSEELPSTIESAVLSGMRCAEAVIQDLKN